MTVTDTAVVLRAEDGTALPLDPGRWFAHLGRGGEINDVGA